MPPLNNCSKHRHISEFKIGDMVRIVCTKGRIEGYTRIIDHLGAEAKVEGLSHFSKDITELYTPGMEKHWGGLLFIRIKSGSAFYISPRGVEKI